MLRRVGQCAPLGHAPLGQVAFTFRSPYLPYDVGPRSASGPPFGPSVMLNPARATEWGSSIQMLVRCPLLVLALAPLRAPAAVLPHTAN